MNWGEHFDSLEFNNELTPNQKIQFPLANNVVL